MKRLIAVLVFSGVLVSSLVACGGSGGGSSSVQTPSLVGVPFTSELVSGKVLKQQVSISASKTYTFNADKSVTVVNTDGSQQAGTWLLNQNGTITVTLPDDVVTMYLIQGASNYLLVTMAHTKGSTIEPNISLGYMAAASALQFTPDMLDMKPLQQVIGTTTKTFNFSVYDNTVSVVTFNGSTASQVDGAWSIDADGNLVVELPDDTLTITLSAKGTSSLTASIAHTKTGLVAESPVSLNYIQPFTAALMLLNKYIYAGVYNADPTAALWTYIQFSASNLVTGTEWATADTFGSVTYSGGWDANLDTGTLDIVASTGTVDRSSRYTLIGVDTVNQYWTVFASVGPASVPVVERWYYGSDAANQVLTYLQTGN